MVPFGVVSQGVRSASDHIRSPSSSAWLLVKSTEGMLGGLTGRTQKQGSAEAGSGGRKRQVFALFLNYIIA